MDQHHQIEYGMPVTWETPPESTLNIAAPDEANLRTSDWERAADPSPRQLSDSAFKLLFSQTARETLFRESAELLEEAIAESPTDAALLSDLAAVDSNTGLPDRPSSLLGLEAALHAIRANPTLLEARFNFALSLENCGLFEQAKVAWERYIQFDPTSGWAQEAHTHIKSLNLSSPLERWRSNWKKRVLGGADIVPYSLFAPAHQDQLESILGEWADLAFRGENALAKKEEWKIRRVANFLATWLHDVSSLQTADEIEAATKRGTSHNLATGFLAFAQGELHYKKEEYGLARSFYLTAYSILKAENSSLQFWASVRMARIAIEQADYRSASRLLKQIRRSADLNRDRSLYDQYLITTGLTKLYQADLRQAVVTFDTAQEAATLLPALRAEAFIYYDIALDPIGQTGWRSSSTLEPTLPPLQKLLLLRALAEGMSASHPEIAELIAKESLTLSGKNGLASWQVRAYLTLARLHYEEEQAREASVDLQLAERTIESSPDPGLRARLRLEVLLTQCLFGQGLPSAEQIRVLNYAANYFSRHYRLWLPTILGARASIHLSNGEKKEYQRDLRVAIRLQEQYNNSGRRSQPFDQPKRSGSDFFEKLIAVHLAKADIRTALDIYERSLVLRPLADKRPFPLNHPSSHFGSWSIGTRPYLETDFSAGFPNDVTLIEFCQHGGRLIAWTYGHRTLRRVTIPASIKALRNQLPQPSSSTTYPAFDSEGLSRSLLVPLATSLPRHGNLLLLGDSILANVWFSKLIEPSSRQPLDKNHGITEGKMETGSCFAGDTKKALQVARMVLVGHSFLPTQVVTPLKTSGIESISKIRDSMPSTTTLVEYKVSGKRSGAWVVRTEGIHYIPLPASPAEIQRLADRYHLRAVHGRSARVETTLEQLDKVLIEPLSSSIPDGDDLVFVPGAALFQIPFPALKNKQHEKFLVEGHKVSVVPSANYYFHNQLRHQGDHREWRALLISNLVSKIPSSLPRPLIGAEKEIGEIARLFPGSEIVGSLDERPSNPVVQKYFEIIHFGGHSVEENPGPSFSSHDRWEYRPTARALTLPLSPETQLVVLAACQTALDHRQIRGYSDHSPGELLDKGVPTVLASHWAVRDAATSQLMIRFYRHLHDGMGAAASLRQAQVELLHGEDRSLRQVSAWGGFQIYGYGGK